MLEFQMFHSVIFHPKILSTYVTMIIILGDYPCGKEILHILYSGKVTDLANGSSHNNAGFALIRREVLGQPACNSCSEEQRFVPNPYHNIIGRVYNHQELFIRFAQNIRAKKNYEPPFFSP